MTYEERIKFYEKVGNAVTEVFKKKFPNLCKIAIYEGKPVVLGDMEFFHDVELFVYTIRGDRETDLYEIDKFIRNYFGIKTNERHRLWRDGCSQ
jgi:hypothetical protein